MLEWLYSAVYWLEYWLVYVCVTMCLGTAISSSGKHIVIFQQRIKVNKYTRNYTEFVIAETSTAQKMVSSVVMQ